ncbi:MAG TPA: toll/interleukin-1 receptor domain-containing protein [Ktedonobacteraceae bacterium]|jgi:hypothetical protein
MSDFTSRDFFISYAQEDWKAARWISQQLEEAGYTTVVPARDFLPARNFILEMDAATQARRTLAVLSPHYLASAFTRPEWAAALRQDPTGALGLLLPVRICRCSVQGLLAQVLYIDLVGQNEERARKTLLRGVERIAQAFTPAAGPPLANNTAQATLAPPQAVRHQAVPPARTGAPFPKNWNVSRRHAFYFTGRDAHLERVFQQFVVRDPAHLVAPQALVGSGGLGKTQTAAEYAYRYRGTYQTVLWARAESEENLSADFAGLTRLLGVQKRREDPVETMQTWFAASDQWLLILDNADDLALVERFFPRSPRGHVLVTTRVMATGNVAQATVLGPLEPEDGALCILRRAGTMQWHEQLGATSALHRDAAIRIAELMGGLPLALEQAGAYIEDTAGSASRYLELYEQYRARMIQEQYGALANYPLPVAAAWEISKKAVEQERLPAAEFLQYCALLDPESIPEDIFLKGASALGPELAPGVRDRLAIDQVTAILRRYALLNREVRGEQTIASFSMHRIIQEILLDDMDEATRQLRAERIVRAVALSVPFVPWSTIRAQVHRCLALIEQGQMSFPEADQLRRFADNNA